MEEEEYYDLGWSDGYNDKLPNEDFADNESYMEGWRQGSEEC